MIILKLIIVIFLTLFLWLVLQLGISAFRLFSFFKGARNGNQQNEQQPQNTMVKCATCNLYVIRRDAISRNGRYFCSVEHLDNSR